MAKILNEMTVITGTYTNAQGQQKNRYQKIGSIIETKNGPMGKIDVIPLKEGGWDGWAYINDPRPREMKFDDKPIGNDMEDDMPF